MNQLIPPNHESADPFHPWISWSPLLLNELIFLSSNESVYLSIKPINQLIFFYLSVSWSRLFKLWISWSPLTHESADLPCWQDHVGQDNAGQDHAGQDNAGQDHAGQDYAGQDHAGQDHAGQDHVGQDHVSQDHAGQDHASQYHAGQDLSFFSNFLLIFI